MPSANFRFLDLPFPLLTFHITGFGEPDRVRKFLVTATRGRHMLIRANPGAFIPFVVRELMRHTAVIITTNQQHADLTYSFDSAANGAPQLRIVRRGKPPLMLYQGLYFKWLRNRESTATRPPGRPRGTTKAEMLSRAAARLQRYQDQHKNGTHYTPEQKEMRKQYEKLVAEQIERSAGQRRRYERKLTTPKMPSDFRPGDELQRKLTVDFSKLPSIKYICPGCSSPDPDLHTGTCPYRFDSYNT